MLTDANGAVATQTAVSRSITNAQFAAADSCGTCEVIATPCQNGDAGICITACLLKRASACDIACECLCGCGVDDQLAGVGDVASKDTCSWITARRSGVLTQCSGNFYTTRSDGGVAIECIVACEDEFTTRGIEIDRRVAAS